MEAIIAGATGLTGNCLLQMLLNEPAYTKVTAIVRSPMPVQHAKLFQLVVDFDQLENYSAGIKGDVVFCALGTTRRKTPDITLYRKIDYQYPLDVAAIALRNGATQYHLISALGANANSSLFYPRLKGELERDLKKIPYRSIYIYRPSLLDGKRKEARFVEKMAMRLMHFLNPLLTGRLRKYRSIPVERLAMSMLQHSLHAEKGIYVYDSDKIL